MIKLKLKLPYFIIFIKKSNDFYNNKNLFYYAKVHTLSKYINYIDENRSNNL